MVIDEEILDDQGENPEPAVPEPPKAMFSSDGMEINQEDDVPNSPVKQSSEIQSEVPTEIDEEFVYFDPASTIPEADRQKTPSASLSSQSSDPSSGQKHTLVPSVRGDDSESDAESDIHHSTSEEYIFQEDTANPTRHFDHLMETINDARKKRDRDEFQYEFLTHRVDTYPGKEGISEWIASRVYYLMSIQDTCVTSLYIGRYVAKH